MVVFSINDIIEINILGSMLILLNPEQALLHLLVFFFTIWIELVLIHLDLHVQKCQLNLWSLGGNMIITKVINTDFFVLS